MSRKIRIEKIGFYHIINRGVAKNIIFKDENDYYKFLEIIQDSSTDYNFKIYSYCLMSNHYHLLLKTKKENLSIIMQKINSRYSIYFNNKYKRVGPLWQGRFKSWFVYDEFYLKALVKYIEFNPIKAKISKNIGEYKWAMSSYRIEYLSLNVQKKILLAQTTFANFELIDAVDFDIDISENEQKNIDAIFYSKLKIDDDKIVSKELKPLDKHFENLTYDRELAIYNAMLDGYMQNEIATYLNISNVTISKIIKIYKKKVKLFKHLRDKGIFWSYAHDITYDKSKENLTIEYILKYGDFLDIKKVIELFGKRLTKNIWENKLRSDKHFIKLNLLIARVFFGMNVESDYFKGLKNERFEKLKLLTS